MTEQHKPEHRISAVEKRITHLEGDIQEHAADTAEELKSIREEIKQSHLQIGKAMDSHAQKLTEEIQAIKSTQDEHSNLLKEQGELLRQILNRLPPIGE
jgi:DNA repair exonuclease SbcCD ATPase subunit